MQIDTLLIELADVVGKIENVESLLDVDRRTPLAGEEREHVDALLTRLLAEKERLEDALRAAAGSRR